MPRARPSPFPDAARAVGHIIGERGEFRMTASVEVVAVAFIAQLAVLPGEKGQFIIAALSTRYRPLLVVAAAGSAFAGWTVLEIVFGGALQSLLPATVMDALTASLFLVFGVMLYRSAPGSSAEIGETVRSDGSLFETDGGLFSPGTNPLDVEVLGYEVPNRFGGFVSIFAMMASGEFGDKTQLVTISLAAQYGPHPGIWVGEMAAIIPISLLNAYLFHRFSHRVDVRKAHYVGAVMFAFFGADMVLSMYTGVSLWGSFVDAVITIVLTILTVG